MNTDLSNIQRALASAWGGPVRLAPATAGAEIHVLDVQRLVVEHAPPGMPATVVLKRVANGASMEPRDPASPAQALLNIWASLEFMQEIFGEASLLPRLYAGDQQAGWLLIEDLPDNDPLRQALWGHDPQQAQSELLRFMALLGELHACALSRTDRYLELRQALGGYIHFLDPSHEPALYLQTWVAALAELGFGLPAAALDEMQAVAELLTHTDDALTFLHGDAAPGRLAETGGRLRLQDCEETGLRHALLEGVNLRMLFPTSALAFVRRIPDAAWRPAEAAYRAALAPACPAVAEEEAYARALTAASVFRAMSGSLWGGAFSLQWALTADDHPHVDDVRRVRLARYDAFVQTATEFGRLPNLQRYFSDLSSALRERWPGAADELALYPAFAAGADD